jgi:hypothetical protein
LALPVNMVEIDHDDNNIVTNAKTQQSIDEEYS